MDAPINSPADLDWRLDLTLEEIFPAGDLVSVICC